VMTKLRFRHELAVGHLPQTQLLLTESGSSLTIA
jgi:hypothetical protein